MAIKNPTKYVTVRRLNRFNEKMSTLYADKATVEELQQQVAERYQVTVTGHTCVFGNNAIVTGHKLVLT